MKNNNIDMEQKTQAATPDYSKTSNKKKAAKWVKRILMFFGIIFLFNIILGIILIALKGPLETALDNKGFTRTVIRDGSPDSVIVVIPLSGVIGASNYLGSSTGNQFLAKLDILDYEKALKAVIILIDSPGGSATESDIIYNRLKNLNVPKIALLGNIAASGGYYVAAGCDEIIAHPTTLTGSIGVIIQFPEISGLLENIGIEMLTIKSGPHKDMLSPYRSPDSYELEMLQTAVDEIFFRFIESVSAGRGMSIEEVKNIADGSVFSALTALEYDLIDAIGYMEDAIVAAEELSGAANCLVVMYNEKKGFFDMIGLTQKENITPFSNLNNLFDVKGPLFLYTY